MNILSAMKFKSKRTLWECAIQEKASWREGRSRRGKTGGLRDKDLENRPAQMLVQN